MFPHFISTYHAESKDKTELEGASMRTMSAEEQRRQVDAQVPLNGMKERKEARKEKTTPDLLRAYQAV